MNEIANTAYNRIAESSDLIVVFVVIIAALGYALRILWKRHVANVDSDKKAIIAKDEEIARLNTVNSDTLKDNIGVMTKMLVVFDEVRNDIKDVKNGN